MLKLNDIFLNAEEPKVEKPVSIKKSRSVKVDALTVLNKVLDDVLNVNNCRVDTLRKICHDIESGKLNHGDLVAFLKSPSKFKKRKTKTSKI